jgi:hypothetical protein
MWALMRRVTLILGPPCAGKSKFAQDHASTGDMIIDWDQLAVDAGSTVDHDHLPQFRAAASAQRKLLEQTVTETDDITAWVIRTVPRPSERGHVARRLNATETIVIDPGLDVCLRRARELGRHPDVDAAILRWYGLQFGARCYDKTSQWTNGAVKPRLDPRHTAQWKRVRALVLRDATHCLICGKVLRFDLRRPHPDSPTVDHIVPIEQGGAWYDLANLRPACWDCNTRRRNGEPEQHRTSEAW